MKRRAWLAYLCLLALLLVQMALAGGLKPAPALPIMLLAGVQALVLLLGLVELRASSALVRVFALASLFWLLLMFAITLGELLTRQP
ncbi:hypothetical protein [Pseudomonas sp. RIT-PI-AD]|uniref:hypothetical protein n=1 Tax=Pseudomonas sp. RIT-PI-AD TaxID=3035294 RepID=UPI0021DB0124|nr:hypothetical protein [Pseudomonas sp. RIT-PI-AD]